MIWIVISLFFLASTLAMITLLCLMKTAELTAAVTDLANVTVGLTTSIDAAVAALLAQGQPSTPDIDIIPLIAAIDAEKDKVVNLKAKLDAALTPPQP